MLGFGSPNLSRQGAGNVVSATQMLPRFERCTLMSSVLLQTDRAVRPATWKTLPSGRFGLKVGKVFVFVSTGCLIFPYPNA